MTDQAFWQIYHKIHKGTVAVRYPERSIMRKKVEDKIIIEVKQEDLEESIAGLSQLLPVLLKYIAIGNEGNISQTMIAQEELSKHFNTAIDTMTMLYAAHVEDGPVKEEILNIISEVERYRKIGSIEEFEQLKKKNTPAKVKVLGGTWIKCQCGQIIHTDKYCPECGQRLEVDFCTK